MQNNNQRDIDRVEDVLEAIEHINNFTKGINFENFFNSILIQSATVRQFEIIGEATDKISLGIKETFFNVEWRSIKSFRNLLTHEYSKVNISEVWNTIQNDLPTLKEQMEDILTAISKNEPQ